MSSSLAPPPPKHRATPRILPPRSRGRSGSTVIANGEPMIWLTGGALAVALAMIVGLLALVLCRGLATFWPQPLVEIHTFGGEQFLGEVAQHETYRPSEQRLAELPAEDAARIRTAPGNTDGSVSRHLLRTGNYDLTGKHYRWLDDALVAEETLPEWAVVIERLSWGRFYGTPQALLVDGREVATSPPEVWDRMAEFHPAIRQRQSERVRLAKHELGALNRRKNAAQLAVVAAQLTHGADSPEHRAAQEEQSQLATWEATENARLSQEIAALDEENARYQMRLTTADGKEKILPLDEIVRAYAPNRLSWIGKLGIYLSRWWEFLSDNPREANSEGGVFPAIWGTVAMTLIMSIAVVPFGVLAALYLREYAQGWSAGQRLADRDQ